VKDESLTTLGLEPDLLVLRDASALLDPRFLGALHAEIEGQLGPADAFSVLLQIGFATGLRDAQRALDRAFAPGTAQQPVTPPALALRFQVHREDERPGSLEVRGSWPERNEAAARLAQHGRSDGCTCFLTAGYTSGWLSGTLDADIVALETRCAATGAEACDFVAREAAAWRALGDPGAAACLDSLPFQALRDVVESRSEDPLPEEPGNQPEAAVVHIWGPVMVIPYSGGDEALRAVDLIGNDPAARDVSVVVVDLAGAIVDEAFGAVALEQIVETAEAWGAETIFAEVSALSEPVLSDMARPPLLIRKDLNEAIAVAFQIARSQRASL
jgi:hypothetical protein